MGGMDFSRPGRAPEPLSETRVSQECQTAQHQACTLLDIDAWNRSLVCSCPCHKKK